jgi:hypothetical protein
VRGARVLLNDEALSVCRASVSLSGEDLSKRAGPVSLRRDPIVNTCDRAFSFRIPPRKLAPVMRSLGLVLLVALANAACGEALPLQAKGLDWHRYVTERQKGSERRSLSFRPDLCDGYDLRPDSSVLTEANLLRFLHEQRLDVQVQHQAVEAQNPDLNYLFVSIPGVAQPVSLRVATLPNADEAGRALSEAIEKRGRGSWGVHRSNLAVLGPSGSTEDDVAVAATSKLACWGTFTSQDAGDAIVIPGGYAEP